MSTDSNTKTDRPVYIYTLSHPVSGEIRYVGKTTYKLTRRLDQHIHDATSGKNTHKTKWIRSLLREGITPAITLLETCTQDTWSEQEKYWIRHGREELGWDLTNGTTGGQNGQHSEESRAKLSRALTGNKNSLGTKHTEEAKRKMSEARKLQKPPSAEHRQRVREAAIGNKHAAGKRSSETSILLRRLQKERNIVGEKHPMHKVTEQDVRDIRRRYAAGEKQIDIAPDYGMSNITISDICRRKTWKHVED